MCSLLKISRPCSRYHRSLFTLPNLPTPWDPEVQTYNERKILPYGQKQLYDIVSDVAAYPRFVPFCTGSRIVTPPPREKTHGAPFTMEAELTVGFLAFKESYISQVACHPYESVEAVASSSTPLFNTLSTTWRFQPASQQQARTPIGPPPLNNPSALSSTSSRTVVTLNLTYAFANPLYASISSAFFSQVSKLMVKAFEERCLDVYGPP